MSRSGEDFINMDLIEKDPFSTALAWLTKVEVSFIYQFPFARIIPFFREISNSTITDDGRVEEKENLLWEKIYRFQFIFAFLKHTHMFCHIIEKFDARFLFIFVFNPLIMLFVARDKNAIFYHRHLI